MPKNLSNISVWKYLFNNLLNKFILYYFSEDYPIEYDYRGLS